MQNPCSRSILRGLTYWHAVLLLVACGDGGSNVANSGEAGAAGGSNAVTGGSSSEWRGTSDAATGGTVTSVAPLGGAMAVGGSTQGSPSAGGLGGVAASVGGTSASTSGTGGATSGAATSAGGFGNTTGGFGSASGGRGSVGDTGGLGNTTGGRGSVGSTGGIGSETGGTSASTGGSSNASGGRGSVESTGGTSASTGGTSASTGGGGNGTGGTSASTGGGGNGTGGMGESSGGVSGGDGCEVPPPPSELIGWATQGGTTTTGGGDATPQIVTTLAAFKAAAEATEPAVIHVKGVLESGDVSVASNKTIVGLCGAEFHGHLELSGVSNVIVRNLTIVGYGSGDCSLDPDYDSSEGCSSGADAISVMNSAHHIWFDHCDISDGTDGNLDITKGADYVTVSWTKFHYTPRTDNSGDDSTGSAGHRYSNLVGGSDSESSTGALNVTWHHNWWADNVVERQPRVRFGKNHVLNNLYTSTASNYCVRAGYDAHVLLEGNTFDGVKDPHEFNSSSDQTTAFITGDSSNVYNGASGSRDTGGGGTPFTDAPYDYVVENAAEAATAIRNDAGPQ